MKSILVLLAAIVSFSANAEIKRTVKTECEHVNAPYSETEPTVVFTKNIETGVVRDRVVLFDGWTPDGWIVDTLEETATVVHQDGCWSTMSNLRTLYIRYAIEDKDKETTGLYTCSSSVNICTE